jgi:nitroreductase
MDFADTIRTRRSIRAYEDRPIEEGKLARVLEAARRAPTAANRQPIRLYVVRSPETRQALRQAYPQDWFVQAPVIVCGCAVPGEAWERVDGRNYADVDLVIAMDHLILAATAEGLGTCWIGAFNPELLRKALDLPEGVEPIALTPLGYPAAQPRTTDRKQLDQIVEYR